MKLSCYILLALIFFACTENKNDDDTNFLVEIINTPDALLQYNGFGNSQNISAPVFEINGKETALVWEGKPEVNEKTIYNSISEKPTAGWSKTLMV